MKKYKHILAAVDLSPATPFVLQRAREIAKTNKAKLSLVHVHEHSPLVYGGEFSIPIDISLEQKLENIAQKALGRLSKKYHINPKDVYLREGAVRNEVLNLAKKIKVDLIIVGSHGHRGLDLLLGSRANAILHHAQCDVLAVRIKKI